MVILQPNVTVHAPSTSLSSVYSVYSNIMIIVWNRGISRVLTYITMINSNYQFPYASFHMRFVSLDTMLDSFFVSLTIRTQRQQGRDDTITRGSLSTAQPVCDRSGGRCNLTLLGGRRFRDVLIVVVINPKIFHRVSLYFYPPSFFFFNNSFRYRGGERSRIHQGRFRRGCRSGQMNERHNGIDR